MKDLEIWSLLLEKLDNAYEHNEWSVCFHDLTLILIGLDMWDIPAQKWYLNSLAISFPQPHFFPQPRMVVDASRFLVRFRGDRQPGSRHSLASASVSAARAQGAEAQFQLNSAAGVALHSLVRE